MAWPLATFCPNCKGIMRPRKGVLECLHCSDRGRARTIMAKGKRIALAGGQQSLTARRAGAGSVEPPLAPKRSDWRPPPTIGAPHPQLGLFPHEALRPGQRRFARDVTIAVAGKKHLVAEAPTGIGKTAASLAPALQAAINADKTVMFLTGRQSQHRIAVDTLRQIAEKRGARFMLVDMVAKRDMCLRDEAQDMHPARFPDFCAHETRNRTCQYLGDVDKDTLQAVRDGVLHVEELMQVSKEHGLCPYLVAGEASKRAQVVVADYNHLFSDIRDRSLERLGIDLSNVILVVDEAHNLPDRVRQNHAHHVGDFLLDQVAAEARKHRSREVMQDINTLKQALKRLAESAAKEGRAEKSKLDGKDHRVVRLEITELQDAFTAASPTTLGGVRTLRDAVDAVAELATKAKKGTDAQVHAESLHHALDDWGRFQQGALRYLEWEAEAISLHVRLLDPAVATRDVFAAVHSAILMSGTLRPPEVARDVLGLDPERTTMRQYQSPFPAENRVVVVAAGVGTRYKDRGEAQWNRMADIIHRCLPEHGNVAVFAPSYQLIGDIGRALELTEHGREVIEEDPNMSKADRDGLLDQLRGAERRKGAILLGVLGGSFSEGIDFRDNLLRAVFVAGLPLAPPDLQTEATIEHYDRTLGKKGRLYGYIVPAMQKALQAMGRGVRSETDRCAVVLLDERYRQHPYITFLPAKPVFTQDPAGVVQGFYDAVA